MSVHVGLNTVNPKHYDGWQSPLAAAEADATAMSAIAAANGMTTKVLLAADATRAKVLTAIRAAAKVLRSGDLFFFSFSGCGGQIPNYIVGHEGDRLDETFCLYDAQLIETELLVEFRKFAQGCRVLVVQDTSHSGTVTRAIPLTAAEHAPRLRIAPVAVVLQTYRQNKAFYDKLQLDAGRAIAAVKVAEQAILVITSSMDNQTAIEDGDHGVFTKSLLAEWDNGTFTGDYKALLQRVTGRMPGTQSPSLSSIGTVTDFVRERPFSVVSTPARR